VLQHRRDFFLPSGIIILAYCRITALIYRIYESILLTYRVVVMQSE
jgi:hypothetical protein